MNKAEFYAAIDKKLHEVNCCGACGKPFVEHDGITRTCARLQEALVEIEKLKQFERDHPMTEPTPPR